MLEELDLFLSAVFSISRIGNFLHQVKGQIADPQQEAGGSFSCTDHRKRFWISKWTQLPYKTSSVVAFSSASTHNNILVQI